ncbi:MAG: hypothetical protein JO336_01740 [Acidobacteriia bacterium]|nr:hypothetical protein [Terriglobia bacterium]
MKTADRLFGWLQILGACGHSLGTILLVPFMSGLFVWSLRASIGMFLTAALNLLRAGRPDDRTVALLAMAGSRGQLLLCLAFGKSIANFADPRVVGNCVIAAMLFGFGVRTLATIRKEEGTKDLGGYQPEPLQL